MKKSGFNIKQWLVFTFAMLISFGGYTQHRLVLLHPTVANIENIVWMVENKIIDIPDVELVGVYSANESYNYEASERYLASQHPGNYKLRKIEGTIKPEDIYRQNSCTPAFRKLFEESDAILFFGGPDIPAAIYNEKQHLLTEVTDPNRHYFETSLFFHLIGGKRNKSFKPFLADKPDFIVRAFCLGMQTMNVAAGGTLIQDIPLQKYRKKSLEAVASQPNDRLHRSYVAPLYPLSDLFGGNFHAIRIAKKGYLHEISMVSGAEFPRVLSYHHQAVDRKGSDLEVIATSMDHKIVEALQHTEFRNVVGVQFHPEPASLYKPEAIFTTAPGNTFSPQQLLTGSNSLLFHKQFWNDFSEKVMENKRLSYKN